MVTLQTPKLFPNKLLFGNNSWINKSILINIRKYFALKVNENTIYQDVGIAAM